MRAGPGPYGDGSTYRWQREDGPQANNAQRLPALIEHLDHLEAPEPGGACTADLGRRWMLVYTHEGDLTGVVIDYYGCTSVRLTDGPFHTAPSDPDQEGTVPGVSTAPAQLLADMKAAYRG